MWRGERIVFLDEDTVVAECARRFALRAFEGVVELARLIDQPHALTAAARDRFYQHRIADRVGFLFQVLGVLVFAEIAGRYRYSGSCHQLLRRVLEAHREDAVRLRPDPDQAGVNHRLREVRILGEEPVTGMDRLRASLLCRLDDLLADEIALARRAWPNVHRFVGHSQVQRLGVRIGIDRDCANSEPPRGADHAAGDLPAVGYEEGRHHRAATSARDDTRTSLFA